MRARTNGRTRTELPLIGTEDGWKLIEEEARRSLGLSAAELVEAWNKGDFDSDPDRPEVMRVVMLLPLAR